MKRGEGHSTGQRDGRDEFAPFGGEIELSDEEEAALDEIWAEIANEESTDDVTAPQIVPARHKRGHQPPGRRRPRGEH